MRRHRYLGIIPARGGSKRIPRKNLQPLAGRPLLDYTIEAAKSARRLEHIVVSTDSVEIAEFAQSLGIGTQGLRPARFAQDDSPMIFALQDALARYEGVNQPVDAVVLLQPTSPFRAACHIDSAIEQFEQNGADTLIAVRRATEHPYWTWRDGPDGIVPFHSYAEIAVERSDLPAAYVENGAIYIIARSLVSAGKIYGKKITPYLMDDFASIDIDTPEDMFWAEFMLSRRTGSSKTGEPAR